MLSIWSYTHKFPTYHAGNRCPLLFFYHRVQAATPPTPTFLTMFFLWEYVHLGFGYFLFSNSVRKAQQSWTKSKSCCYSIVIMSLQTNCYPTYRSQLYVSKKNMWLCCIFTFVFTQTKKMFGRISIKLMNLGKKNGNSTSNTGMPSFQRTAI